MGTQKRERQKANRAAKQAAEIKAAKTSAVKRNVIRWVVIAVAALGGVLLLAWLTGAFDSNGDDPVITIPPLPVETVAVATPASVDAPVVTTAAP